MQPPNPIKTIKLSSPSCTPLPTIFKFYRIIHQPKLWFTYWSLFSRSCDYYFKKYDLPCTISTYPISRLLLRQIEYNNHELPICVVGIHQYPSSQSTTAYIFQESCFRKPCIFSLEGIRGKATYGNIDTIIILKTPSMLLYNTLEMSYLNKIG